VGANAVFCAERALAIPQTGEYFLDSIRTKYVKWNKILEVFLKVILADFHKGYVRKRRLYYE
jgi:hypothetical protein